MAIGDIAGDLATAWMTPAQRAAKNGVQSLTGGPIARASGQAATVGAVAGGLAAAPQSQSDQFALNPNPQHLGEIYKNPSQLVQPPQPASLASAGPVGVTPTATSPTYPTNSQAMASLSDGLKQSTAVTAPGIQQPINAVTAGRSSLNLNQALAAPAAAPESNASQPIDNTYRLTGTGTGSNAIAARVGADGVPEFSNQASDLAGARLQGQINNAAPSPASLADLRPGGRTADPSAPFASLGSASNLGDGIGGGLSVGAPGDSQLALTRFQRANDIRALGAAQDRADLANYRANQGAQIGIVRDSSKPLTRSDLAAAQLDQQKQAGLVQNAGRAQQSLEDLRTGQTAATQTRQAQRLEDAWSLATAPNATDADKQRYQTLTDPTGAGAQARQLAAAKLAETEASTRKITAETNALGGPGKLTEGQGKDLQYFARANAANSELAKNGSALTSQPTGDRGAWRSATDTLIRSLPVVGNSAVANGLISNERQLGEQSGSELVNALLRKDSGAALTESEMATYGRTYLPQSGDGEAVLKQKQEARTRAVQGIRDGLGSAAILAAETNRPQYRSAPADAGKTASPPQALRVKGPEDVMGLPSGTVFIGPDGKTRRIP
jgi:hypothetical protein